MTEKKDDEAREYDRSEAGIIANLCASVVEQIADLYDEASVTKSKSDIEIVTEALKAAWAESRKRAGEKLEVVTKERDDLLRGIEEFRKLRQAITDAGNRESHP